MLRKTSKTAYCRIRQARKYSVSGGGARWKLDETTFAQVGPRRGSKKRGGLPFSFRSPRSVSCNETMMARLIVMMLMRA